LLQQLGTTGGNTVVLGESALIPVTKRNRPAGKGKDIVGAQETST